MRTHDLVEESLECRGWGKELRHLVGDKRRAVRLWSAATCRGKDAIRGAPRGAVLREQTFRIMSQESIPDPPSGSQANGTAV